MAELTTKTNNLKYIALLIIPLALIATFFAGVEYQKHQAPGAALSSTNAGTNGNTFGSSRGGFRGGNGQAPIIGDVTAVSSSSLSVQTRRGATDTVNVGSSTQITNGQSTAQLSDIQTGDRVIVFGTMGSNNTITASRISVNPTFGGGNGAPPAGGPATQTN